MVTQFFDQTGLSILASSRGSRHMATRACKIIVFHGQYGKKRPPARSFLVGRSLQTLMLRLFNREELRNQITHWAKGQRARELARPYHLFPPEPPRRHIRTRSPHDRNDCSRADCGGSSARGACRDCRTARRPVRMQAFHKPVCKQAHTLVFHRPVHMRCIRPGHKPGKPMHYEHRGARLEPVEAGRDCRRLVRKPAQERHTSQARTLLRTPGRSDGKQTGPSALQTGHTVALVRTAHRPAGHKPHSPHRD